MRIIEDQEFDDVDIYPRFFARGGQVYDDVEFRRCRFINCVLGYTSRKTKQRLTIRNMRFAKCHTSHCYVGPHFLEDIMIDGLQVGGMLTVEGVAFKHVVIRGRVGTVLLRPELGRTKGDKVYTRFLEANQAYYRDVDWAVDISDAEFSPWSSLYSLPVHLTRRDPERQVVMTRVMALECRARQLKLKSRSVDATVISLCENPLIYPDDAAIINANKSGVHVADDMHDINLLRKEGLVVPD